MLHLNRVGYKDVSISFRVLTLDELHLNRVGYKVSCQMGLVLKLESYI